MKQFRMTWIFSELRFDRLKMVFVVLGMCVILCGKLYSQNDSWELLNPRPTFLRLEVVEFVDANRGYTATDGSLYATDDAGNTWNEVTGIAGATDIEFVGEFGIILQSNWLGDQVFRTYDGGTNWEEIDIAIEGTFRRVQIFNTSTLVVTTSTELVTSPDAGDTWVISDFPDINVENGYFHPDGRGVIASSGGEIYYTDDSGITWTLAYEYPSFPNGFYTVEFASSDIGFATSENINSILKTTDGGVNWQVIDPGINFDIYDIEFINQSVGFMTGEYGAIYKTVDGGNSWQQLSSGNFGTMAGSSHTSLFAHDENTLVAVGSGGRILRTSDNGNTWTFNTKLSRSIIDLYHINENVIYALTNYELYKSSDGGFTWEFQSEIPSDYGFGKQIIFTDENNGYLTRQSQILGYYFKTDDGGLTWEELPEPNQFMETVSYIGFYHPDTIYTSTGYTSTGNPSSAYATYRVTEAGTNWELIYPNTLYAISFVSGQEFYGIEHDSGNGRILKTADAGATWEVVLQVQDTLLRKLHFPSPNVGYCLVGFGYENGIFKTINGGEDWEYVEIPGIEYNDSYRDIHFINEEVGYILEEDGYLLQTSNGGIDWSSVGGNFLTNQMDIFGNYIYLSGSSGVISRHLLPGIVSTKERTNDSQLWNFYPNPSNGIIMVEIPDANFKGAINIIDMNGRGLKKLLVQRGQRFLNVDLSSYSNGIYILNLQSDQLNESKLLILE